MEESSYFICFSDFDDAVLEIRKLVNQFKVLNYDEVRPRIVDTIVERYALLKKENSLQVFSSDPDGFCDPWRFVYVDETWKEITKDEYNLIKDCNYSYQDLCQKYPSLCRFL